MAANLLRNLPTLNEILDAPPLKKLISRANSTAVVTRARELLEDVSRRTTQGVKSSLGELAERIARTILAEEQSALRWIINASGDLLRNGQLELPLADTASAAVAAAARHSTGFGGTGADNLRSRLSLVEPLLCELTGAEAGCVVSSPQAGWLLVATALAKDREILQIGDAPAGADWQLELARTAGCTLRQLGESRDVGGDAGVAAMLDSTNQGHRNDEDTHSPPEVVRLAKARNIPSLRHAGDCALVPLTQFGLEGYSSFKASIDQGFSLVLGGAGGLVGGPDCGIILGKRDLIEKLLSHPLAIAMQPDRLTLAALDATLKLYREPDKLRHTLPILQLLSASTENLKLRAGRIAQQLAAVPGITMAIAVEAQRVEQKLQAPKDSAATWCVEISLAEETVDRFAERLSSGVPAVIPRAVTNRISFDISSVLPRQDQALVDAVSASVQRPASDSSDDTPSADLTMTAHA